MPQRLRTLWQRDLKNGSEVVSVLINQAGQYAGSNGKVYLLDMNGDITASNDLPDTGNHEVRLAAPPDASMLVVGTNGYVLALHPTTLVELWRYSLKDAGFAVVSVLYYNEWIYAASNGYAFRINPSTGIAEASNGLEDTGNYETRLDITIGGRTLVIGIHGEALGLNPMDMTQIWRKSLPDCGYGVVSICGGAGGAYAGCNGHVYRLDQFSGDVLKHNDLPGVGECEVRMVVSPDSSNLYVGTNGYGFGLCPDELTLIYKRSFEGSGYTVTDVVNGVDVGFFANNGYVFQVDDGDRKPTVNPLPDRGNHETRIAVPWTGAGQMLAGIHGWVVSMALDGYPMADDHPWMGERSSTLAPKMLREIALPGTHDSGTYAMHSDSPVASDNFGSQINDFADKLSGLFGALMGDAARDIASPAIRQWSVSQTSSFYEQLAGGIRYLDLRVQGDNGGFVTVHGLFGAYIKDLFIQVNQFCSRRQFDKEVLILDFNHFYEMTPALHRELATAIGQAFGDKLIDKSEGQDVTLGRLWQTSKRILVLYDDESTAKSVNFLWPSSVLTSHWPDKQTAGTLITDLEEEVSRAHPGLFILQGVVTPDTDMIVEGMTPFTSSPSSLLECAKRVTPRVTDWLLSRAGKGAGVNIVIVDWFNHYEDNNHFVQTVVDLNE